MNQLRRLRGHNREDNSGFEDNMPPVRSRRCSLQRCESKTNLMDTAVKNHDKIMKYASLRPPIGKSSRCNNKKIARLTENNGSHSQRNEDELNRGSLQDARKSKDDETMPDYKLDVDENNPPRTSLCTLRRTASNVTNSSMKVEAGDMRPVSANSVTKRQNKNLQKMFQKARKTNAPMGVPVVKENRFVQNQVSAAAFNKYYVTVFVNFCVRHRILKTQGWNRTWERIRY